MLTLKAPAKINWFLKVYGLRDDGFHEIDSLIQKITLHDVLTFSPSADLILETDSQIPQEENLVYKAAMVIKTKYGIDKGAYIHLDKKIPMAAGLGGGSSDAAAALFGLSQMWSIDCSINELCVLAEQLGSDVPFFLHGSLSLVYGRGEKVRSLKALKKLNILLVKPPVTVSTARVYKKFSEWIFSGNDVYSSGQNIVSLELTKKVEKDNNIEHFIRNIENLEFGSVSDAALNDLESVTVKEFPIIDEIKEKLRNEGALFSSMSGSGPTVFGVFETLEKARKASEAFNGYWTAVAETIID